MSCYLVITCADYILSSGNAGLVFLLMLLARLIVGGRSPFANSSIMKWSRLIRCQPMKLMSRSGPTYLIIWGGPSYAHLLPRVPMNTRRRARGVMGRAKPSMTISAELQKLLKTWLTKY
jgi:hypothetical protein